jgi:DNA-binding MarR family transcriptional regulator/predicted N-acetyltransferase YhbS
MSLPQTQRRIAAVRRFNRFFTRRLELFREDYLHSPFTLTEGRVLYELGQRAETTATQLGQELGMDAGYLSRILRAFDGRGLLARRPHERDARQSLLSLTEAGRAAFEALDAASSAQVGALLASLPPGDQAGLVEAMERIERVLGPREEARVPYLLRAPQPGDLGWVVHRHGVLYAEEHGWDERFEGLVARVVADFAAELDPRRERCWIAERAGEVAGSVFLVRHPEREGVARLRLLLVEPSARGLGIGRRLVEECTRFARRSGYHTITLWTNSVLHAARAIYEAEGYRLVREEPHRSFGPELVGQTWELTL